MVKVKGKISKVENQVWYTVLPVDKEDVLSLIEGDKRIILKFKDGEKMHCALMPDGTGNFFININKKIRKRQGIVLGEEIEVTLTKDTSKYGMPVPEEYEEIWSFDDEFKQYFHELTPGRQRNLLHLVNKVKSKEVRIKKVLTIRDYLVDVKGKIDFKELNQAFKYSKH